MHFPHFLLHTFKSLIHAKHWLQLVMLKGTINDQDPRLPERERYNYYYFMLIVVMTIRCERFVITSYYPCFPQVCG